MNMYDYIRCTTPYASLFWVFMIFTGEVILMKLFLALFINNYLEIVKERGALEENEK